MFRKIRTGFCGLFLVWTAVFVQTGYTQENVFDGLDAYIRKAMHDWQVPGVAVAVVKNDSVYLARGYGVRELGKGAAVDAHTLFAIASNSKAFTATLLAMLVHDHRLQWSDHVIDHLQDFQMYDPYVTRELNVMDLLTHRSGLPTFGGDQLWIGGSASKEEIIHQLRFLKPSAPFRTTFQYQNLMFLVAGQLIPAITGQSWAEAVREKIFRPLGMDESNTSVRDLAGKENVASPHEVVAGKLVPIAYDDVDNVAPAGGINSNVLDMVKWMRFNLHEGVFSGKRLLKSALMQQLHSIQNPLPVSSFSRQYFGTRFSGYGMGWGISDYHGRKMIRHSGGLSGMISLQTLLPEEQLGVIVLTNFAPNRLPWVITDRILTAFLGEPQQDWNAIYLKRQAQSQTNRRQAEQALQESRARGTRPSLPLENYTGRYEEDFSGQATVKLQDGRLVFDYNPRYIGELEHWHYDTFRVHWQHPIFDMAAKTFLTFYLNEQGKVDHLTVTFYDPITFRKVSN